jgi:hypothetical protein
VNRIVVTMLKNDHDSVDIEIPNNVAAIDLIEELVKFQGSIQGQLEQYDLEFSLSRTDWQKVEKHYSFQDVGVYDGVYIRIVKTSSALSAPSIHPAGSPKPVTLRRRPNKKEAKGEVKTVKAVQTETEGNEQKAVQTSADSYVWKVID